MICKYCYKYFSKGSGGHVAWCIKNLNRKKRIERLRQRPGRKHTEEEKAHLSKIRRAWLKKNPSKVPYLLNHSSCSSYPEKLFKWYLKKYKIKGWVYKYRNGIYEYDFAFPLLKIDIEIDGKTHEQVNVKKIDKRRDAWSRRQGWIIIRISASNVLTYSNTIIKVIKNNLSKKPLATKIKSHILFLRKQTARDFAYRAIKRKKILKERTADLKKETFSLGWVIRLSKKWNTSWAGVHHFIVKYAPSYTNKFRKPFRSKKIVDREKELKKIRIKVRFQKLKTKKYKRLRDFKAVYKRYPDWSKRLSIAWGIGRSRVYNYVIKHFQRSEYP